MRILPIRRACEHMRSRARRLNPLARGLLMRPAEIVFPGQACARVRTPQISRAASVLTAFRHSGAGTPRQQVQHDFHGASRPPVSRPRDSVFPIVLRLPIRHPNYEENINMSDTETKFPEALVTFHNKLPARWEVDIVEVACKFVYDDGHNDDMAQKVRIRAGETHTLRSSYSGCCRAYFTIVKSKAFDGTDEDFLSPGTATVEQGKCGTLLNWYLVRKQDKPQGATLSSMEKSVEISVQTIQAAWSVSSVAQ